MHPSRPFMEQVAAAKDPKTSQLRLSVLSRSTAPLVRCFVARNRNVARSTAERLESDPSKAVRKRAREAMQRIRLEELRRTVPLDAEPTLAEIMEGISAAPGKRKDAIRMLMNGVRFTENYLQNPRKPETARERERAAYASMWTYESNVFCGEIGISNIPYAKVRLFIEDIDTSFGAGGMSNGWTILLDANHMRSAYAAHEFGHFVQFLFGQRFSANEDRSYAEAGAYVFSGAFRTRWMEDERTRAVSSLYDMISASRMAEAYVHLTGIGSKGAVIEALEGYLSYPDARFRHIPEGAEEHERGKRMAAVALMLGPPGSASDKANALLTQSTGAYVDRLADTISRKAYDREFAESVIVGVDHAREQAMDHIMELRGMLRSVQESVTEGAAAATNRLA